MEYILVVETFQKRLFLSYNICGHLVIQRGSKKKKKNACGCAGNICNQVQGTILTDFWNYSKDHRYEWILQMRRNRHNEDDGFGSEI